jgi:polyphosphate glucokinase
VAREHGLCKATVEACMNVLVVDIGGTHVKLRVSGDDTVRRFPSGPGFTPAQLVRGIGDHCGTCTYDAVAVGYPGAVGARGPSREPGNLADGWVGFDFAAALGRPVRIVNDAVLQALGAYEGGRMLFLGLGTGLGSALVSEHVVVPLELGCLPYGGGTMADALGRAGLEAHGEAAWRRAISDITALLRGALVADYVVLGGGNAERLEHLPPHTRRGGNADAFTGGFRLWGEAVDLHHGAPPAAWRVVR